MSTMTQVKHKTISIDGVDIFCHEAGAQATAGRNASES